MRRRARGWLLLIIIGLVWIIFSWDGLGRWMYPMDYVEPIGKHASLQRVDPYLIAAMIRVESNFDPTTVSPKGAVGIMQLMPDTAAWILKKTDSQIDPQTDSWNQVLSEPETNIRLGTWYVHYLQDTFNGNEALILAAYNAGQGTVRRWLDTKQWDGQLHSVESIPFEETRQYVKRVLFFRSQYADFYEGQWKRPENINDGPSASTAHPIGIAWFTDY